MKELDVGEMVVLIVVSLTFTVGNQMTEFSEIHVT